MRTKRARAKAKMSAWSGHEDKKSWSKGKCPHGEFMRTKRAGAKAEMSAWSIHEDKKSWSKSQDVRMESS